MYNILSNITINVILRLDFNLFLLLIDNFLVIPLLFLRLICELLKWLFSVSIKNDIYLLPNCLVKY